MNALPTSSLSAEAWKKHHPYSAFFGKLSTPSPIADHHTGADENPSGKSNDDTPTIYKASCHCERVQYEVLGDPLDAKLCHCPSCQKLHGAPFEWVAVFRKEQVRFPLKSSLDYLYFYSSSLDQGWTSVNAQERILPVKVSCSHCRTPIADEGRNMWLAFATLFGFTLEQREASKGTTIPDSFRHSCHLFYNQRCIDLPDDDGATKWQGHKEKSPRWEPS